MRTLTWRSAAPFLLTLRVLVLFTGCGWQEEPLVGEAAAPASVMEKTVESGMLAIGDLSDGPANKIERFLPLADDVASSPAAGG